MTLTPSIFNMIKLIRRTLTSLSLIVSLTGLIACTVIKEQVEHQNTVFQCANTKALKLHLTGEKKQLGRVNGQLLDSYHFSYHKISKQPVFL